VAFRKYLPLPRVAGGGGQRHRRFFAGAFVARFAPFSPLISPRFFSASCRRCRRKRQKYCDVSACVISPQTLHFDAAAIVFFFFSFHRHADGGARVKISPSPFTLCRCCADHAITLMRWP